MLADARPATLLAHASSAVVLADALFAEWLALASYAVVLADARFAEWLALASNAVVLAERSQRFEIRWLYTWWFEDITTPPCPGT